MTDNKYSRLGLRLILETLNPASNSDDEDIFLSESIADRPELRVQLRYFTVELEPSRCSTRKNCKRNDSRNTRDVGEQVSSGSNQKNAETETSASSIEATISCDSFHSCRSTLSIQELSCKGGDSNVSGKTQREAVPVSGIKNTVISDEDLLSHLTMVNAIFLSKSANGSIDNERSSTINQKNTVSSCISQGIPRVSPPSNKVCSEAYTCQVNHNPRVKYISKVCGGNMTTKNFGSRFDTLHQKMGGDRLSYTKTFSESFEPVLNTKKSGFKIVEDFNTYDSNDLPIGINEALLPNLVCGNNVFSDSLSNWKWLKIKVPEITFDETIPLCDESCSPVVLDQSIQDTTSNTDQKRRTTVPGCEESLEVSSTKNILSTIYVKSDENILNTTESIDHGDVDFSGYAYTENSGQKTVILQNMDDSYLKTMISKSLKKIQNENESSSRLPESNEYDIVGSEEKYDDSIDSVKEKYPESTNQSSQQKKLKLNSCFEKSNEDRNRIVENVEHEDGHSLPLRDECGSDEPINGQGIELVLHESSELMIKPPENGLFKRGRGERKRTLPVIQEEDSEDSWEGGEDFREDNLADDYCLIDSNGRPIHLFDNQGLPLTDYSGRPLRSAQGKLMMSCDQNGIPVVDHDCSIFDVFGRQPHEDRFDPSMAPERAVCSKLSTGDGRPLLLFDAQGRPLTSVSGTMLVNSSGRGLVQFSTVPAQDAT